MTQAVFFDRDGTLNVEKGYIKDLNDLELINGAAQAIRLLQDNQFKTILVTNQTGAARGFYDEEHIKSLNQRLDTLIYDQAGVRMDALIYCPHMPIDLSSADPGKVVHSEYQQDCDCRKPRPGMIRQALKQFPDITINDSFMVGDKASDLELANNAGCTGIMVKTGYGTKVLEGDYQNLEKPPEHLFESVLEAAHWIVSNKKTECP